MVGKNFPYNKTINIDGWNDIILVDRKYFLEHIEDIQKWANQ